MYIVYASSIIGLRRGLTCGYICEDTTDEMKRSIIRECQLVYATPESLMNKRWRQMLCTSSAYIQRVRAVIFDEAHCIDKWFVFILNTIVMLTSFSQGWNF